MKASDIQIDGYSSLLLKGPFGFGKTLAAATFALDGPVWLSYWDKKSPVELVTFFKRFGSVGQKILNNIEVDFYGSTNANEYLNKLIKLHKDCRYIAIINDSVTMMTSGAVNWSLGFRDNKKAGRDKDKIMPDFDEYKVETSLVTQALDICRTLPCHVIWTCHPVPSIKIEGSGASIIIKKTNPIVTYGSKVAGIVPGQFSEIYHFSRESSWDSVIGKNKIKHLVSFEGTGEDDFAKSNLGLTGSIDITDAFFYEIWKKRVKELKESLNEVKVAAVNETVNPFANVNQPTEQTTNNQPKWNSSTGKYE